MNEFTMRTWAEIDLNALDYNVQSIRESLPETTAITAVVKADGYGHGSQTIAKELNMLSINSFAVSNISEALALRHAGIKGQILILGYTPVADAKNLSEYNIEQACFSAEYAKSLNDAAASLGISIDIHIKLDTGMSRIGFVVDENNDPVMQILNIKNKLHSLNIVGIFTHFSSADTLDEASIKYTKQQETYFFKTVNELVASGVNFEYIHLQNSAGIAFCKTQRVTNARAGIILYGAPPSNESFPIKLKPVMSLKSVVAMIKESPAGKAFSYGRTYISDKKIKVATVPIGYADGYPRLLSNKGEMLLNGVRCPVIGNICMDQLMLDISDVKDAKVGDIVTIVGNDGEDKITFDDLANKIGTINYELMCLIGRRVPRVYKRNNQTISIVDYIASDR